MDTITALAYQGLLEQLKFRLFSNDFMVRYRQTKNDFTRKRCLTFVIVVIFLLNLIKRSGQDELDEYFKLLNGTEVAVRIVTKSAFTQVCARNSNMGPFWNSIKCRRATSTSL